LYLSVTSNNNLRNFIGVNAGSEVLIAVTMKGSMFSEVTLCSPIEINCFSVYPFKWNYWHRTNLIYKSNSNINISTQFLHTAMHYRHTNISEERTAFIFRITAQTQQLWTYKQTERNVSIRLLCFTGIICFSSTDGSRYW
jgi:hypothetical protein